MLIHFSILGVILIVSLFSERRIRSYAIQRVDDGQEFISQRLPWIIILGYIAFLAAMRTNTNDTSAYINSFNSLDGSWEEFWTQVSTAGAGKDWAFAAVNILFKIFISNDYHLWLALYAVAESAAFIYILRRNAVSLFDCCFFLFCSTLYYNYFSMMRQWFAVVMLFAASNFIKEKKFLKFLVVCLIVAQFHNSAYMMIPVYFLVQGKAWSRKQISFIVVFAFALLFLNPILGTLESSLSGSTYDYAISAMNAGAGSSIIRALIAAVPVVLAFMHRDEIDNPMINLCVNMSLLNLLLNLLASFTSGLYIIRFTTYISVYNLILYPYLLNIALKGNDQKIVKAAFYVIYFCFYIYQMQYQGAFYYSSDILGTFK